MSQNRQARRRAMRETMGSKFVSRGAPRQSLPVPPPDGVPRRTLRLPLTLEQQELLLGTQAKVNQAIAEQQIAVRGVLAQHRLADAHVMQLESGRTPKLVVSVPDPMAPAAARKRPAKKPRA